MPGGYHRAFTVYSPTNQTRNKYNIYHDTKLYKAQHQQINKNIENI